MQLTKELFRVLGHHRSINTSNQSAPSKGTATVNHNIPRRTLFWLLVINIAVLIPLYSKITTWTLAICAICFIWRTGIFLGRVAKPPKMLVSILALAAAVTLVMITSQLGALNALINLLILGYALKFIEMRQQRDVKAVVLVGYFLIALTFIDNQSVSNTLHLFSIALINACALISLYQGKNRALDTLLDSAKLMFISLPLAGLLFIMLPRFPPLWMVPQPQTTPTGLSEVIRPGDIQRLTRSPELAFRATFEGEQPPNEQLYWRALVLDSYNGSEWQQSSGLKTHQQQVLLTKQGRNIPQGNPLRYQVIAEPSGNQWLFGLDLAYSRSDKVANLEDYRLLALNPIHKKMAYDVASFTSAPLDKQLSQRQWRNNLTLPHDVNPQTKAFAQQLAEQYPEPEARMQALMQYFYQQPFFYTLSPPPLGRNQIDDFMFHNQAGFCVHYAGAMVIIARASGLPARMVTGYQGGEFNPTAGYVSVYQYMAHAWAEIWHPNRGWVRYDPTAMVAPERVLSGFDAVFSPEESYLEDHPLSSMQLKTVPWLNQLRMRFAGFDYYWTVWVLGFNPERQQQLWQKMLGGTDNSRLILFMLGAFALISLLLAWYAGLLRPRKRNALYYAYASLCHQLQRQGVPLQIADTPAQVAVKTAKYLPTYHSAVSDVCQMLETVLYAPCPEPKLKRHTIRKLRQLRLALKFTLPAPTWHKGHHTPSTN